MTLRGIWKELRRGMWHPDLACWMYEIWLWGDWACRSQLSGEQCLRQDITLAILPKPVYLFCYLFQNIVVMVENEIKLKVLFQDKGWWVSEFKVNKKKPAIGGFRNIFYLLNNSLLRCSTRHVSSSLFWLSIRFVIAAVLPSVCEKTLKPYTPKAEIFSKNWLTSRLLLFQKVGQPE